MPAFLLALVVHEFAHAWMASYFGDKSAESQGRLTMNPAAHMDPFGTVLFPLLSIATGASIFFGWAKPVPIDTRNFTNYRKGMFWVSAAGVIANILLGFITAFGIVAFSAFVSKGFAFYDGIQSMLYALLMLNFSLAIFNLLPIPPLDGSNIILAFLSPSATRKYLEFQQYSFFLLLFLMFSGVLRILAFPIQMLANISLSLAAIVFGFA